MLGLGDPRRRTWRLGCMSKAFPPLWDGWERGARADCWKDPGERAGWFSSFVSHLSLYAAARHPWVRLECLARGGRAGVSDFLATVVAASRRVSMVEIRWREEGRSRSGTWTRLPAAE